MAKQITELSTAGAITGGTDLLWLEQAGLPKKLTIDALSTGMGVVPPKTDTATITSAAWYRIATNSSSAGRGAATIYISNSGGGASPSPIMIRITKGYQATLVDAVIDVVTSGAHFTESIEQVRIIFDQTGSNEIHVEVYIQGGAGSDYTHVIEPDGSLGTWASVDYTAGATADFALTWDLATENVGRGSKDGDGHASWVNHEGFYEIAGRNVTSAAAGVVVDARGDAYIHLLSDRVSDAETNNPYILFSQDGAAVTTYIGSVGAADLAPNQGVMTGMPNNGFAIVHQFATGSIGLGVNQRCAVLIDDDDHLIVQFPTTGDQMHFYHDNTNGVITTSVGAINIVPQSGTVNMTASAVLQAPTSSSISNQYNVTTNAFDVDMQYRIGGTLTALVRWDSSLNTMTWMDRDPGIVNAMVLDLDTGRLQLEGAAGFGGDTVGLLEGLTGGFGSVQCNGAQAGSWEGFNIAARGVFMWHPTSERGGIYDDVNNRWCLQWNTANASSNEQLDLHAGASIVARTQVYNVSGTTSGLEVADYGGTMRDVGFATMETITFTANTTVTADHWSQKCLEHTNATTHTLTFNTLSTVPNGAVMWVKATTGIVTLVDGSMVLAFYNGGGAPATGNISVAIGGWATIHKTGNSLADVTGVGLS